MNKLLSRAAAHPRPGILRPSRTPEVDSPGRRDATMSRHRFCLNVSGSGRSSDWNCDGETWGRICSVDNKNMEIKNMK